MGLFNQFVSAALRQMSILPPDNLNQELTQIGIPNADKIYQILSTILCAGTGILFAMSLNITK